jgi:hypothetical protein
MPAVAGRRRRPTRMGSRVCDGRLVRRLVMVMVMVMVMADPVRLAPGSMSAVWNDTIEMAERGELDWTIRE